MSPQAKEPPPQAGVSTMSTRRQTAIRIATNIAHADPLLRDKPAEQWKEEHLYIHLERAWLLKWNEEKGKWEQQ